MKGKTKWKSVYERIWFDSPGRAKWKIWKKECRATESEAWWKKRRATQQNECKKNETKLNIYNISSGEWLLHILCNTFPARQNSFHHGFIPFNCDRKIVADFVLKAKPHTQFHCRKLSKIVTVWKYASSFRRDFFVKAKDATIANYCQAMPCHSIPFYFIPCQDGFCGFYYNSIHTVCLHFVCIFETLKITMFRRFSPVALVYFWQTENKTTKPTTKKFYITLKCALFWNCFSRGERGKYKYTVAQTVLFGINLRGSEGRQEIETHTQREKERGRDKLKIKKAHSNGNSGECAFSHVYSLVNELHSTKVRIFIFFLRTRNAKIPSATGTIRLFVFVAIVCVFFFFSFSLFTLLWAACSLHFLHACWLCARVFRALDVISNQLKYVCVFTQNEFNVCSKCSAIVQQQQQ